MKKRISKSSYDPNWQPSETKSEIRIKKALENHGFIVRHNEKICGYYPDIHIANTNLLIEIDGAYHSTKKQRKRDAMRTKHLEQLGFKILRFSNDEAKNINLVIKAVREALGIRSPKKVEIISLS
jgi:very-short-patch-repair endonuclease